LKKTFCIRNGPINHQRSLSGLE